MNENFRKGEENESFGKVLQGHLWTISIENEEPLLLKNNSGVQFFVYVQK